jgi:hypothetical protein
MPAVIEHFVSPVVGRMHIVLVFLWLLVKDYDRTQWHISTV